MSHPMFGAISHTTSQPNETIDPFQVGLMEEKVKLSNLKNVDSAGSLHRKYQELLKALRGKDELIGQLQAQLEKQVGATVQQSARALNPCTPWPQLLEQSFSAWPSNGGVLTPSSDRSFTWRWQY